MKMSENVFYLAKIHGRFGWNERPFTRADFDSKFTSILITWNQFMQTTDDNYAFFSHFICESILEKLFFFLLIRRLNRMQLYLIESEFSSRLTRHTNIPHTKFDDNSNSTHLRLDSIDFEYTNNGTTPIERTRALRHAQFFDRQSDRRYVYFGTKSLASITSHQIAKFLFVNLPIGSNLIYFII